MGSPQQASLMASGVGVDDSCQTVYNELKMSHSKRYVIFKLNDDKSKIVVDCVGEKSETYDDFKSKLPSNDCRYGVVDFEFKYPDGRENQKIVFVFWTPDSAAIKSKMVYASTKENFKKTLVGLGVDMQATDMSEVDVREVLDKIGDGAMLK